MKRLFTCLVMMSALPMMAFAQVWNGEGTKDNPYQITSDEEMQAFAYSVNSGNDYSGIYFSLSEDVTTGPIATDGNIFSGVFDGNGHTITVSIHSGYKDVGLFGRIENATIRELKVAGSLSSLGDLTDGGSGALVGYAKNSTITDCHNSADIDCAYKCNGGICGYSEGSTIQYCTNSGDVRALRDNQDRTGGICGLNYGGTITNCSNSGHITGDDGVGGIVGEIYSLTPLRSAQEAQVAYCYNEGGVVGNEYVAGIVGEADEDIIGACYNVGPIRGGSEEGPAVGIAGGEKVTLIDCGYLKGCVSESDEGMEAPALIEAMSPQFTLENGWASAPSLGEKGEIIAPTLATESNPDKPTGIEDIEQAKVYAQEGGVYVQTAQPTEVIIISMNGTIIKRETQIGAKHYELSRGIYVICINEQRYKVRI